MRNAPCSVGSSARRHALHQPLGPHPVLDQVRDRDHQQAVLLRELRQLRHARHRAVLVHDFADDAGRIRGRRCAPDRRPPRSARRAPARRRRARAAETRARAARGPTASSSGSMAASTVAARSAAEMPVLTSCLASIDTQNAVSNGVVLALTASGISSSSSRWPVIDRQISPRPCFAMKLIASGVTFVGGHRQVAFVLAVLVVDDDDHPAGADGGDGLLDRRERAALAGAFGDADLRSSCVSHRVGPAQPDRRSRPSYRTARATYFPTMSHSRFTRVADPQRRQVRVRPGERDDHHVERVVAEAGDGQADAVDGHRPLADRSTAPARGGNAIVSQCASPSARTSSHRAGAVDVTLHEVAAEAAVGAHRPLEVDRLIGAAATPSVVTRAVSGPMSACIVAGVARGHGQADAVDRQLSPGASSRGQRGPDAQPQPAAASCSTPATSPTASMRPVNISFDQHVRPERVDAPLEQRGGRERARRRAAARRSAPSARGAT